MVSHASAGRPVNSNHYARERDARVCWLLDTHPVTAAMLVSVGWFPSKNKALKRLRRLTARKRIRLVGTVCRKAGRPEHVYCRWRVKPDHLPHEVELTELCFRLHAGKILRGPHAADARVRRTPRSGSTGGCITWSWTGGAWDSGRSRAASARTRAARTCRSGSVPHPSGPRRCGRGPGDFGARPSSRRGRRPSPTRTRPSGGMPAAGVRPCRATRGKTGDNNPASIADVFTHPHAGGWLCPPNHLEAYRPIGARRRRMRTECREVGRAAGRKGDPAILPSRTRLSPRCSWATLCLHRSEEAAAVEAVVVGRPVRCDTDTIHGIHLFTPPMPRG